MTHAHQELDIFRTYLDINDIPHDEQWIELAHRILHQQHRQIITFHPWGFVLYYFDQFIKGEIDLEQFMTMGDVSTGNPDQINPYLYKEEHPCYLDSITLDETKQWIDSDIVIVDPTLWAHTSTHHLQDKPVQTNVYVLH